MTSKFSIDNKELLQRISSGEAVVGIDFGNLIVRELAAFRLAAMDSEPVAGEARFKEERPRWTPCTAEHVSMVLANPEDWPNYEVRYLYTAPQPAPVVDADDNFYSWFGREWQENYQHNQYTTAAKQMLGVMAESAWKAGRRAAMLQAEPVTTANKLGNSPVIPDTWIPVSERMPENKPGRYEYLVFEKLNNRVNHDYWNVPNAGDDTFTPFWNHYGEYVTHWMPLPAAPREVKLLQYLA
ncbi:DUF551 domain-containing protein [Klebsiella aerogenes]|uniref:DUF551 domain-containing protein n=1 Tax=Klebsiella aerogenes TaxID=548 RepID=UPI0018665717|nr:DUF551 domain-containing protein [Klebsiella aerogenes]